MPQEPLWRRLYFNAAYYELARLVGYAGLTLVEFNEKVKTLQAAHGQEKIHAASEELLFYDYTGKPPTIRLHADVRKLCYQLLGFPPDHPEYAHSKSSAPWVPPWCRRAPEPERPVQEKPKRKPRAKKPSAAPPVQEQGGAA